MRGRNPVMQGFNGGGNPFSAWGGGSPMAWSPGEFSTASGGMASGSASGSGSGSMASASGSMASGSMASGSMASGSGGLGPMPGFRAAAMTGGKKYKNKNKKRKGTGGGFISTALVPAALLALQQTWRKRNTTVKRGRTGKRRTFRR